MNTDSIFHFGYLRTSKADTLIYCLSMLLADWVGLDAIQLTALFTKPRTIRAITPKLLAIEPAVTNILRRNTVLDL